MAGQFLPQAIELPASLRRRRPAIRARLVAVAVAGAVAFASACAPDSRPADAARDGAARDGLADAELDAAPPDDTGVDVTPADTRPPRPCRMLSAYPGSRAAGGYYGTGSDAPPNDYTSGGYVDESRGERNQIFAIVQHGLSPGGSVATPARRTFTMESRLRADDVVIVMSEGCASTGCLTHFLAQGGDVTVTAASRNGVVGRIALIASRLRFVEWNTRADAPVDGGRCVEIASFALDIAWGSSPSCAGRGCAAPSECCTGATRCAGSLGSSTYCTFLCSTTSENCSSTADCCTTHRCLLGTCVVDTCVNSACTRGFDMGGCCAHAPYCVGRAAATQRCATTCGATGSRCTTSEDCCTPGTCDGGMCVAP